MIASHCDLAVLLHVDLLNNSSHVWQQLCAVPLLIVRHVDERGEGEYRTRVLMVACRLRKPILFTCTCSVFFVQCTTVSLVQ